MTESSLHPSQYDVEELREAVGLEPEDARTMPNYECRICGFLAYIEDYHRVTPNYCESCETVNSFVKM